MGRTRGPVIPTAEGVRVAVRVTPKAVADRIGGLIEAADGATALKVAVTAAPEDGKANAATIRLLAQTWKLPARDFSIITGISDRRKVMFIAGEPATLTIFLQKWIDMQLK